MNPLKLHTATCMESSKCKEEKKHNFHFARIPRSKLRGMRSQCTFRMWLKWPLAVAAVFVVVSAAQAADVPQRKNIQNPQLAPELVKKTQEETAKAIKRGDDLWHDRSLGTNGMACNMCHPDAAVTHPETYPKYKQQFGRVVSVQQFINWCIQVPLQGKSHELGSDELVALEAYMNDQNRGQAMEIGVPGP